MAFNLFCPHQSRFIFRSAILEANFSELKNIATIFFLIYYSFGVICLPMGDFSKIGKLTDMYAECKEEYPDINPVDFVFEHLMNLEKIIDGLGHSNNEKKELPHHPFHVHTNYNMVVHYFVQPHEMNPDKKEIKKSCFVNFSESFVPTGFSNNFFRPPIAWNI